MTHNRDNDYDHNYNYDHEQDLKETSEMGGVIGDKVNIQTMFMSD